MLSKIQQNNIIVNANEVTICIHAMWWSNFGTSNASSTMSIKQTLLSNVWILQCGWSKMCVETENASHITVCISPSWQWSTFHFCIFHIGFECHTYLNAANILLRFIAILCWIEATEIDLHFVSAVTSFQLRNNSNHSLWKMYKNVKMFWKI